MKKLLGIVVLGLLLVGCSTTNSVISENKLKKDMTKYELNSMYFLMDPFADPFVYGAGSEFYSDINKEIIWGMDKSLFYVFRGVSKPVDCGILMCNKQGNGTLESLHYTLNEARESISKPTTKASNSNNKKTKSSNFKKGKDAMVASIKDIPGVADAGWPQDISLWIFMSNPNAGHDFDRLGYTVCNGAVTNFGVEKGYSITFWNPYNKKEIGKFRCY